MAKATKIIEVYYFGKTSHNDRMFITERERINIIASNEGIATVVVSKNCETTAKILAGCLEKESNFNFFFKNFYEEDIKGFEFFWEGVDYLITPETDMDELIEKILRNKVLQQKTERKRKLLHKKILELDATTEIQFKDETAEKRWNHMVAYAETLDELKSIAFARRYAKIMQHLILKHGLENSHLISASIIDAVDKDGIIESNVMQFTFDTLKKIWVYGDDF